MLLPSRLGSRYHALAPRIPSLGFALLHAAGILYTLYAALLAWAWKPLLALVADHIVAGMLHGPSALVPWLLTAVFIPFAVVALLAGAEAGKALQHLRRRSPEPNAGVRLRGLLYGAVGCLVFNAFVLSTPVTASGPFLVKFPLLSWASVMLTYGAYCLWSLSLSGLQRVFPFRLRRLLDVTCMNVALVLMLAEIGLRITARVAPTPLLVTRSTSSTVRRSANRGRPGTLRFNFPLNSGGFYDTEFLPADQVKGPLVISIGDSYSYGTVPHAFHFTTVAERDRPGLAIYNMGFPAIGPVDYLYLLMHEALPLHPALVIVNLFMGNDVTDVPTPVSQIHWYDASNYLVATLWNRVRILRWAKVAASPAVVANEDLSRQQLEILYPWLADPLLEQPNFSADAYRAVERRSASVIAAPGGNPGFDPFFKALSTIELATHGTPLGFMVIPDPFEVEDSIWVETTQGAPEQLDRDAGDQRVVAWLRCSGAPVLDLLPILRAVPPRPDGYRHLYGLRDTHFNARGNEVTGHALAHFVDSLLAHRAALRPPSGMCGVRRVVERPLPSSVSLPLHVDIGNRTARPWMQTGWSDDEASGAESYVWSDGPESVLTIPLPDTADIDMHFEALPFVFPRSPGQRIAVVVNGVRVDEIQLQPGKAQYSVELPATALRAPVDTLVFRYAYSRVPHDVLPNSADVRSLAVAWYRIDFAVRTH
jgi:hypothetical protein